MAGSLNIEYVINTHTVVQRRKNSIIYHAPISGVRRLRRDIARAAKRFRVATRYRVYAPTTDRKPAPNSHGYGGKAPPAPHRGEQP